jgi:carboxylate-amine ligase
MDIRFSESAPSTIGVEWELPLVDRATGDLTPRAPAVPSGNAWTIRTG